MFLPLSPTGTLNVTLRAIYASDGAPVASVLSLVRQCLSVLTFIPIIASVNNRNKKGKEEDSLGYFEDSDDDWSQVVSSNTEEEQEKKRPMWLAAFELAFWNFGAQVGLFLICRMIDSLFDFLFIVYS